MIRKYPANEPPEVDRVAILYFTAAWCAPCRMYRPILEKLSDEFTHIPVYMVDVDENPNVAREFGVSSVPELIAYPLKNGQPFDRFMGAKKLGVARTFFEGLPPNA